MTSLHSHAARLRSSSFSFPEAKGYPYLIFSRSDHETVLFLFTTKSVWRAVGIYFQWVRHKSIPVLLNRLKILIVSSSDPPRPERMSHCTVHRCARLRRRNCNRLCTLFYLSIGFVTLYTAIDSMVNINQIFYHFHVAFSGVIYECLLSLYFAIVNQQERLRIDMSYPCIDNPLVFFSLVA